MNVMGREILFQSFLIKIIIYLIYRIIRIIIGVESLIWMILKNIIYQEKNEDDGNDVKIYDILMRYKFYHTDPSKETDFLYFFNSFTSYDKIISSNNWHFYSLNDYYAYFIYIPKQYTFQSNISFTTYAFKNGIFLAKVNACDFLSTTNIVKNLNGKSIMLYDMPFSCVDDFLALIYNLIPSPKHNDKVIKIFKDYSSLSSVQRLINTNDNLTHDECKKILLNVMRCIMKNQKQNEIWLIEARSENIPLIPYIHSSSPSIIHAFYGRDKIDQAILYYLKEHDYKDKQLKELIVMRRKMKKFMTFFTWKTSFDKSLLNHVKPHNPLQLALTLISKSILDYRLYKKYFINDIIYYERFISDPYVTITHFLENCGLLNQFSIPEISSIKEHQVKRKFTDDEVDEIRSIVEMIDLYGNNKRLFNDTTITHLETDVYL
uniref:Uncharacterized protein n=1 Tax=Strongyloides papillosus TaxID=174720 RepID=A0A0N5B3E5_STREA